MRESVKYFIYFGIAMFVIVDVRTSAEQWENCEGNAKLTNNTVWKCVKKATCLYGKNLPSKLTVACGRDELCCPGTSSSKPSVKNSTTTKPSVKNSTTPKLSVKNSTTSKPSVKKSTNRKPSSRNFAGPTTFKNSTKLNAPPVPPLDAFAKANKIALNMCNKYAPYRYINSTMENPIIGDPDIGVAKLSCITTGPVLAVGGGAPTSLYEFPHMALLGYDDDVTEPDMWLCGGSLISEQFVLSAAHCTQTGWILDRDVKWAALGLLTRSEITRDSIDKNVFRIIQRITHHEYQIESPYNDIALLKLEYPIQLGPTIRPICLHQRSLQIGARVTVTGWGTTYPGSPESKELLKATIRNLDINHCETDESLRKGFNATTMICGGDPERRKDTCTGDSGGPMQIEVPESACTWIQIGITSRGPSYCGNTPSIYTRVSYYLPWIQSLVWPNATGAR